MSVVDVKDVLFRLKLIYINLFKLCVPILYGGSGGVCLFGLGFERYCLGQLTFVANWY
jgi:hypothetical protein